MNDWTLDRVFDFCSDYGYTEEASIVGGSHYSKHSEYLIILSVALSRARRVRLQKFNRPAGVLACSLFGFLIDKEPSLVGPTKRVVVNLFVQEILAWNFGLVPNKVKNR